MPAVVKRGYVKAPIARKRKYPFNLLKEGDYLDFFPLEVAEKVKYAMQKWNRDKGGVLHMSRYPNGSPDNEAPHVVVGWPQGAKPRSAASGETESP